MERQNLNSFLWVLVLYIFVKDDNAHYFWE